MADILALFAPFGLDALLGVLVLVGAALACYRFAGKVFDEWQANNRREARKQAEIEERAQRDRERSVLEGRIVTVMEQTKAVMEENSGLMKSLIASNEVIHNDLAHSQERSAEMAQKVDHVNDRVDMIFEKVS